MSFKLYCPDTDRQGCHLQSLVKSFEVTELPGKVHAGVKQISKRHYEVFLHLSLPLIQSIRMHVTSSNPKVQNPTFGVSFACNALCTLQWFQGIWCKRHQGRASHRVQELQDDCLHAVRTAKFVARKQWIVTGSDDMYIRVYNYNTMDKVKAFEAHTDYIRQA